jgi:ABC-type uncharacterized transport system ATPase subunit
MATFAWPVVEESPSNQLAVKTIMKLSGGFALNNINLNSKLGKLNVIIGATANGKSSLLLGLLGEMPLVDGSVIMPAAVARDSLPLDAGTGLIDSVAFCAQEA